MWSIRSRRRTHAPTHHIVFSDHWNIILVLIGCCSACIRTSKTKGLVLINYGGLHNYLFNNNDQWVSTNGSRLMPTSYPIHYSSWTAKTIIYSPGSSDVQSILLPITDLQHASVFFYSTESVLRTESLLLWTSFWCQDIPLNTTHTYLLQTFSSCEEYMFHVWRHKHVSATDLYALSRPAGLTQ